MQDHLRPTEAAPRLHHAQGCFPVSHALGTSVCLARVRRLQNLCTKLFCSYEERAKYTHPLTSLVPPRSTALYHGGGLPRAIHPG